jgi:RNA polymerase sigma-70 factor (ECF subfamily)
MNYKKEFGKIYDQNINQIYRFVFLKVNSKEKAEDLTAEVFTKGWDNFKKGKDIRNVRAFLYQIARNLVVDYYREKGRVRTISSDDVLIIDSSQGADKKAELDSDFAQVRTALSKIKEDYKDVVIMRYLDQLSVSEISKVMDKSEGSVRVLTHRALNALKKEIRE